MPLTKMTFALCGVVYFLGNILLAWAMLQHPYLSKTLSSPPPQNKNDWVHSVIFEPQLKMQLTRSSYKITSFLDFQPFLQGFQSVDTYIKDLMTDIADPTYFRRLISSFHDVQITPHTNESSIVTFLNSPRCTICPYACCSKMKFEQYHLEIQYIYKVFHAIYKKFLTAIDHIDYHPSQQYNKNTTRVKRSDPYTLYGQCHSQNRQLTPSEENFLDTFLKVLYQINPALHNNLSRMKRTGIFTWLLGWGIFSNARSISKIKDNLNILQKQNQLQDKQIKQLAKYLNLTMHQVDRHSEMLYEMDTKMLILNNSLQHLMWNVDSMRYEASVLLYFQARIYRVHTSLYELRGDTDSLFEYMIILASNTRIKYNHHPPDILKTTLHKVEKMILNQMPDLNYVKILKLTFGHIMEQ